MTPPSPGGPGITISSAMGQAKHKQDRRARLLAENPWCVYCGEPSTTEDHCPPRCFFEGRVWPESYSFACCDVCNREAKGDEQVLAPLTRLQAAHAPPGPVYDGWLRLLDGVRNNHRAVLDEWFGLTHNQQRRAVREAFGDLPEFRHLGGIHLGPLTHAAIDRFAVKLGKALFYRHNRALFEGDIIAWHLNSLARHATPEIQALMVQMAPLLADPRRNNRSLSSQFVYRFNHSPEHGALYAVAAFNPQMVFGIIALRTELAQKLADLRASKGQPLLETGVHRCRLKRRSGGDGGAGSGEPS